MVARRADDSETEERNTETLRTFCCSQASQTTASKDVSPGAHSDFLHFQPESVPLGLTNVKR